MSKNIGVDKRWERKAREVIVKEEAPTYINGHTLGKIESKWPYFDVYEFAPDREEFKDNPILLSGQEWSISLQISLLRAMWQLFGNLKAGESGDEGWVGYPISEWIRLNPKEGVSVHLMLAAWKEPPFERPKFGSGNFEYTIWPRQVSIPWVDRSKLTYESLRTVCGSVSGLNWGNWQARAYISSVPAPQSNKGLRQIVASGSSQSVAEQNLDRFLSLTTGYVASRTCTEVDLESGTRKANPRSRYLKKYDVYPGWMWVENASLISFDDRIHQGKPTLSGKLVSRKNKLALWYLKEPREWSDTLRDLMKSPKND